MFCLSGLRLERNLTIVLTFFTSGRLPASTVANEHDTPMSGDEWSE